METLHTWWATELYPMRERDQFGVSGEFEVALAADAQATIAALQVQLNFLRKFVWGEEGIFTFPDGDTIEIRKGQSREQLEQQLTQRTAELEAIEKILDIDSGKTTVEKVRDLHHSFKQVWESYQDASNEMFKAQAELERVRGELATYKETKHDAI